MESRNRLDKVGMFVQSRNLSGKENVPNMSSHWQNLGIGVYLPLKLSLI